MDDAGQAGSYTLVHTGHRKTDTLDDYICKYL